MNNGLVAATLALGMLAARPALGQIVNVLHQARDAPRAFSGRATGAGKWLSGNTNQLLLEASLLLRYRHERHLWMLVGSGAFGINDGEEFVNKDTVHARYRVDIELPFQLESFVQNDRNPFRRRVTRTVFGGGPRVQLFDGPVLWVSAGVSYMPELERLGEGDFPDAGARRWHHRVSVYTTHEVTVTERLRVAHALFVQPAIDDIDNVRAFSELVFSLEVWREISLLFSQTLQLDTVPPVAVRPVDADRRLSLAWSF